MAAIKDHPALRLFQALYATSEVNQGYIELRGIPPRNSGMQTHSLFPETWPEIQSFIGDIGGSGTRYSCYFGVAKRSHKGDGTKGSIKEVPALWVDIDCANSGINEDSTVNTLANLPYEIRPSALVRSCGGVHAYWFLKKPATNMQGVEDINALLAEVFSADTGVFNVDRIMRIPGTRNPKRNKLSSLVYCHHWRRFFVSELHVAYSGTEMRLAPDGTLKHKVDAEKEFAAIAPPMTASRAMEQAWEDRRKTTNSRSSKAFDYARPGGGAGYMGLDDAMMLYTSWAVCTEKKVTDKGLAKIAQDAAMRVGEVYARYGLSNRYDYNTEYDKALDKASRWVPKWEAHKAEEKMRKKAEKKAATNGK